LSTWPYGRWVGCDGGSEFFEEIISGFLRRAVDEALAELGELSTDLRLNIVGQERASNLVRKRDLGCPLGEAGDAAVTLSGDAVAVGRIEV
jgi:hypothetical protein